MLMVQGDGSVSVHKMRNSMHIEADFSCASLSFCKSIVAYFQDILGIKLILRKDKRHDVYKINNGARWEGYALLKHLYDNCNVYLDRKFEQYTNICRQKSILPEASDDEDGIKRGWRNVD